MTREDSDRLLQDMLDREAIRDLVNRYFVAVWKQDVDAVAALFAEDGEFRFTGIAIDENGKSRMTGQDEVQSFKGRDVLHRMYTPALAEMRPLPFGHNHVVDLTGPNSATGHLVMEMRASADYALAGIVVYEDRYAKIGGKWLFACRFGRVHMPGSAASA